MKKTVALFLVLILALGLCVPAAAAGETDLEKAVARVEQGIRNWQAEVDFQGLDVHKDDLRPALRRFNKDPEFFYYDSCTIWSQSSSGKVTKVELHYLEEFDRGDVEALNAAVEEALSCLLPGMSRLQKLLVLHDYLAVHTEYDEENHVAGTVPEASYTAYGALVLGIAVCQGYTLAYQLLLEKCGIPSLYVSSDEMNHGWCMVELGGSWYHVDVTWDDPTSDRIGRVKHKYFLLSDSAISDEEHKHYGWTAEQACTDTRYDTNVFWASQNHPIIYTDQDTLWLLKENGDYQDQTLRLVHRSWSTGEETTMAKVWDYWPTWEGGAHWLDAYSGLCLWDNRLFFNDSLRIYSYDPADGDWRTEFTYDGHEGYLYGLTARTDDLLVLVNQSPNETGKVYRYAPERKYAANPFRDVYASDYYYQAVLWAYANDVTKGTGDGAFSPLNTCTRGQVVTFLWRAVGCPKPKMTVNPFADVPEGEYYRDAVLWAVENGITNGAGTDPATGKTLFAPNGDCTYAHILTFLWRAVTGNSASSYGDWYSEPMDWAADLGLTADTALDAGSGNAASNCPRCDVVTFLYSAVG